MVLGVTSERAGRLAKKRFRTRPIPFVAQEHIDNLSVFIDGTIPVQFVLATEAEDFVDGPLLSHPPSMRTGRGGQLGAKGLHPVQHRPCHHLYVPLGEQPYHLRGREWQATIPPHCHQNTSAGQRYSEKAELE
jgi:hypothetical protein